ncbi:hypothetical protein D3C80_611560 [compost metagenome]
MRGQAVDPLIVTTGEVATARAFDLDHPGAQVSQLTGTEGRCDRMFEADDGNAVKWANGLTHD